MENQFVKGQKDDQGSEDSFHSSNDGINSSESKSKRLARRVNPHHTVILNVKRLQTSKAFIKDSFIRSTLNLENKIPRHVVALDENYLRRCLELIHFSAAKAARCNISVNLSSEKIGILSDGVNPAKIRNGNTCGFEKLVFECPLAAGTGSLAIDSPGQWIVGSIMGSKSMMKLLKSPLLQKFGALDADADFRKTTLNGVKGPMCYDFMSSPRRLSNCSSQKLEKETPMLGYQKYQSKNLHKRLLSMSSANSTCSDQSSSSAGTSISQGMLQCTWKGGIPTFVFSLDDQREVYVATLSKAESASEKDPDHMYLFHLRKGGQKEHETCGNESHLVGKMKVTTSFSICPQNSKIMETEFVLYGGTEKFGGAMQTSSHNNKKSKGQLKKVVEAIRTSHSIKRRSRSRFGGSISIPENSSGEPCQDTANNSVAIGGANLLEEHLPTNLELAAVIVKDHLPDNCRQNLGGWGLKFLKKIGMKKTVDTSGASMPSACCDRNTSDCSTSVDVLIPAGMHGGPRDRNGGPSSLIQRWRSGGHCECGGWDLGCPLTVLKTRSSEEGVSPQADMAEACKLFDFFIQGSEHGSPTLRITNVHEGLYFVHFQSNLSALQSFSIAVAYIHSQSPALRRKNVQELR